MTNTPLPVTQLPDGTTPVMFWDFDGVLNFDGSRSQRNKNLTKLNLPGHLSRTDVAVDTPWGGKEWYTLNWSKELVKKLSDLKNTNPYHWVWLTTWVNDTGVLDKTLNLTSDATLLWNPTPTDTTNLVEYRNKTKHTNVLTFHNTHPNTPFVWVDDTATPLWDTTLMVNPNVPHLMLTPNPNYGVTLTDLETLTRWLTTL